MQKERTRMYEQNETEKSHSEYVQRKSLCQLVYKKLEDIGTITAKQYQEVLKKYPLLSELYALTKEFCNVLFSNNPAKLDEWINEAQKYDIPELQTFINGIKKDLTAVKNGIIYLNNPVPVSLLSGDRKPQIRFLGNHPSGSGNLYHKSFRM